MNHQDLRCAICVTQTRLVQEANPERERKISRQNLYCAVCIDKGKVEWKVFPCGHAFHGDCFDRVMNRNREREKIASGLGWVGNNIKSPEFMRDTMMKDNVAMRRQDKQLRGYNREAVRRQDKPGTLKSEINRLNKRIDRMRTRHERKYKMFNDMYALWNDILYIADDDSDSDCSIEVAGPSNVKATKSKQ